MPSDYTYSQQPYWWNPLYALEYVVDLSWPVSVCGWMSVVHTFHFTTCCMHCKICEIIQLCFFDGCVSFTGLPFYCLLCTFNICKVFVKHTVILFFIAICWLHFVNSIVCQTYSFVFLIDVSVLPAFHFTWCVVYIVKSVTCLSNIQICIFLYCYSLLFFLFFRWKERINLGRSSFLCLAPWKLAMSFTNCTRSVLCKVLLKKKKKKGGGGKHNQNNEVQNLQMLVLKFLDKQMKINPPLQCLQMTCTCCSCFGISCDFSYFAFHFFMLKSYE